jgi:hypothetical protein
MVLRGCALKVSDREPPRERFGLGLDLEASPGFEPGNDGFANRCCDSISVTNVTTYDDLQKALAPPLALHRPDDPDLARVLAAWDNLPPSIRRAILALVDAR